MSNKILSNHLKSVHESNFNYEYVFNEIKSKVKIENLFNGTNFDHNLIHKNFIVEFIIEKFVKIFVIQRAKNITLMQHKNLVRSAKTHEIHFAGQ